MPKKKIAFVIDSLSSGGAERVVCTLSNHLIEYYDVFIVILVNKPVFYKLNASVTLLSCVESLTPSKSIIEAIKSNFTLYKCIVKYINKYEIDLCIGFMTPNNILATLAAKRCKIPVVISERNNPYEDDKNLSFFWKKLRRFVYPKADTLVVQTKRIKAFYLPFISSSKIATIPNPINPEFSISPTQSKENVVLNVASLTNQKGQDMLIRAFSKTESKNWQLIIIGEGKNRECLQSLIDKLDMSESILLIGRQSDVQTYYAKSKIFAFSSLYEGFPNALQEAMYFGLACISTDCPTGPAEMINQAVNGFLVQIGDIGAMTEKLNMLMSDENLTKSVGLEANKAMKPYHIDKIVEKWMVVFERLLYNHNKSLNN